MQFITSILLAAGLVSAVPLQARQENSGQLTYYAPGLGACGVYSSESDAVVAISTALFDPQTPNGNPNNNALCGRQIQINRDGRSVVVAVEDRCVGCAENDLDVPVAIFQQLANVDDGRVDMTWHWL
ncbi:RlpA-like double-psi beta-barrel-protein domain-containing protein-containing protein [Poronia punctata]|nr:RlpA-like double-psi beta-barrel-protein domain-containing protein-containing protein [Poronia punctata]